MPTGSGDLLRRHPTVLYESAVDGTIRAVGQRAPNYRRNGIDRLLKLRFLFSDHRFGVALLGDISHRSDKLQTLMPH